VLFGEERRAHVRSMTLLLVEVIHASSLGAPSAWLDGLPDFSLNYLTYVR
jgi:hypothetical protein